VSDTNRGDVGGELGAFVLNPGLGGLEPDMRAAHSDRRRFRQRVATRLAALEADDFGPLAFAQINE
jgi:hypothetical protein